MLILPLVLSVTLAAAAPFEVHTLDGQTHRGELTELGSQQVVLDTEAGPVTLPLEKLAALQVAQAAAPAEVSGPAAELIDGALLPFVEYRTQEGTATVGLDGDRSVELPTRAIRWIRFTPLVEPKLVKQWSEISHSKAAGDLLVVRKDDALDYLEGIVRDIDEATCQFELDGELIPVKIEKITGIVYAKTKPAELSESIGKLTTSAGARLPLASFELAEANLKLTTPAGLELELPLADALRFDFSSGKIAYLSDLEPETAKFTPLVGFAQPPQALLGYFEYRRDRGFQQAPLRLDGREFRKGLSLASRTLLVYRLPDDFRLFRATAGIDDATRESGSVRLQVSGDGRPLWDGEVRGSEPAQELELDLSGVRRLEILCDYGEGLDVGDRLNLGDAHVTK